MQSRYEEERRLYRWMGDTKDVASEKENCEKGKSKLGGR